MKQNLALKMQQGLVMTPQLQMAIKILQMPALDLQAFISQEMMENPFLASDDGLGEQDFLAETTDASEHDTADLMESGDGLSEQGLTNDHAWEDMYDGGNDVGGAPAPSSSFDGLPDWQDSATEEETLKDVLTEQLSTATQDATLRFLGAYLIDAIDDAGYLKLDVEEAARRLKTPLAKMKEALDVVQTFDPVGVGARTLQECLALQLANGGVLTPVEEVVLANLPLVATQDFKKLTKLAGCEQDMVMEVIEDIAALNPKPGLQYGGGKVDAVVPDVIVTKKENGWQADLNAAVMPKLLLNGATQKVMDEKALDKEAKSYMGERMSRAQWLMKSLAQRAQTIYKVSNIIVQTQADFFEFGPEGLKPLTLKQVAEQAEVHESTVSRVTNGKYMHTPLGTFELKYFFNSGVNTTGGVVNIASAGVKSMIKKLIDAENPAKPLSDEKLVALLKDEGVDIARRTVAKYREALGLGSSSQRRVRA